MHSDGTISSDDDVEFIDGVGQTKYSVVKEEITPAESRIESAATSRATNPNTPFQSIRNGNNGEVGEESDNSEKDDKTSLPSSASSLRLQALNGEYHVFEENKNNTEVSVNNLYGNMAEQIISNEANNNIINLNANEPNYNDNNDLRPVNGGNLDGIRDSNGKDDKESFDAKILT